MVKEIPAENHQHENSSHQIKKEGSILNRILNIGSQINQEDLLLLVLLFILIDESVEDEFLILMIVILILTEKT